MSEQQYDEHQQKSRKGAPFVLVDGGKGRYKKEVKGVGRKPRPRHENGKMNMGESAYAKLLDAKLLAGEIAGWWFEFMTFQLAEKCSIKPDFTVMLNSGAIELHEVKGGKNNKLESGRESWGFWAEEDARVKLRMAGKLIPFPLYVVWPKKGGHKNGWCMELMPHE